MFKDKLQKKLQEMEMTNPSPSLKNVNPALGERSGFFLRYLSNAVKQNSQVYPSTSTTGWKEDWEAYHPRSSRSACAYKAVKIAERKGLPDDVTRRLQEDLYEVLMNGGDTRWDSLGTCIRDAIQIAEKYELGNKAISDAQRRLYDVLMNGGDTRWDSLHSCTMSAIETAKKYGLGKKAVRKAERKLAWIRHQPLAYLKALI